ncbi:MAG: DUF805 domain-containing protein [Deltaproteobacteria bacterium]|jgi:uncharacterized membrane protein YhaH (DUF805 family)|nr:DUF805 domain-containing protein [Deltaproteobacteria bacterium]
MKYLAHGFANIFNFEGRASRKEFWFYTIPAFIILYVIIIVCQFFFAFVKGVIFGGSWSLSAVHYVISIAMFTVLFAGIFCRRLHDIGATGWLAIACLVISIIGLIVGFIPSDGPNKYGESAPRF